MFTSSTCPLCFLFPTHIILESGTLQGPPFLRCLRVFLVFLGCNAWDEDLWPCRSRRTSIPSTERVGRTFLGTLHTQSEEDSSARGGVGRVFFNSLQRATHIPGLFPSEEWKDTPTRCSCGVLGCFQTLDMDFGDGDLGAVLTMTRLDQRQRCRVLFWTPLLHKQWRELFQHLLNGDSLPLFLEKTLERTFLCCSR